MAPSIPVTFTGSPSPPIVSRPEQRLRRSHSSAPVRLHHSSPLLGPTLTMSNTDTDHTSAPVNYHIPCAAAADSSQGNATPTNSVRPSAALNVTVIGGNGGPSTKYLLAMWTISSYYGGGDPIGIGAGGLGAVVSGVFPEGHFAARQLSIEVGAGNGRGALEIMKMNSTTKWGPRNATWGGSIVYSGGWGGGYSAISASPTADGKSEPVMVVLAGGGGKPDHIVLLNTN